MKQKLATLLHCLALLLLLQGCSGVRDKALANTKGIRDKALANTKGISQFSATVTTTGPFEAPAEVNFVPYRFPKSKGSIAGRSVAAPYAQQRSWLGFVDSFLDKLQNLPSSREAPEYLTQYQRTKTADPDEIINEARFVNQVTVKRSARAKEDALTVADAVGVDKDTSKVVAGLTSGLKRAPGSNRTDDVRDSTVHEIPYQRPVIPIDALNAMFKTTPLEDMFDSDVMPRTTHSCQGAIHEQRVCKFHNLYMWNGTLYYISDVKQPIPAVPLTWVAMDPFDKEVLQVEQIAPNEIPFDDEVTELLKIEDALLWLVTYYDNYGHLLGEHGPTIHNVICTYLGRCTYTAEDLEDFQILLTNPEPGVVETFPSAIIEMFSCISAAIPRQMNDVKYKNKVVIINTALAGIGPTCRGFPWCRSRYKRTSPVPHVMNAWKARIMDCMNLPPNLIASAVAPTLLIINRPLSTGRGFLNINQVTEHIRAHHPQYNVQVRYLENMTFRQQAQLYHNATVLIQMHGAALGNIIFLPRGACIVDIVPMNNEDKHPWVIYMSQDFKPLYYYPIIIPPQKSYLMLNKITNTPEFNILNEQQKRDVVERGVCPTQAARPEYDVYAVCTYSWFLKQSNVELNFENVDSALNQAMAVLQSNPHRIKMIGVPGWRGLLANGEKPAPPLSELPAMAEAQYHADAEKPFVDWYGNPMKE